VKTQKQDKTVAGMAVLKDIRGLLSSTGKPATPVSESQPHTGLTAENARLNEQLQTFRQEKDQLQATLQQMKAHNAELLSRIEELQSSVENLKAQAALSKPPAVSSEISNRKLENAVADLEARKAELEAAMARAEELAQLKVKDLARRIARVYEEAGDIGANRDFRRITNQLEAAQNFGEFVRALARE
jgi:predicted RNase H-like nuclease (RuvC/YqgF family)